MSRSPIHASTSRWRTTGSSARSVRARQRRARGRARARSPTCCASVDTPRSKPSSPIAMRQPSSTSPTTSAASVRASSKNTSLNSPPPVICTIGRTSTPGWSIGTSRNDSPWCRGDCGIGARDHEAPVRHVRERRPHLLTVDHPLVAVELRACRHVGEVGARVGLAVALAPPFVAAQDARAGTAPAARACRTRSASGASRFSPMWLTRAGACARVYSSAQITCWSSVAPRPPDSTGQPRPMNPALPSSCSHATRTSKPTSSSPGPPRPSAPRTHRRRGRRARRDVTPEALVVVGELDVGHRQAGSAMSSTRTPSGSARNSRSMPGLARLLDHGRAAVDEVRVAASRSST